MADFTLGQKIRTFDLLLSPGSNFKARLRNKAGDFDPAAHLELRITGGPTWVATFSEDIATFNQPDSDVDTVIASTNRAVKLWYGTTGDLDEVATGKVLVKT